MDMEPNEGISGFVSFGISNNEFSSLSGPSEPLSLLRADS